MSGPEKTATPLLIRREDLTRSQPVGQSKELADAPFLTGRPGMYTYKRMPRGSLWLENEGRGYSRYRGARLRSERNTCTLCVVCHGDQCSIATMYVPWQRTPHAEEIDTLERDVAQSEMSVT